MYSGYRIDSKRKKKHKCEFNLSKDEFDEICNDKCYLCGHQNSLNDYNGIDRVDSTKSYCVENCKSCCYTCNFLKNEIDIIDFFVQLIKIVDFSIYNDLLCVGNTEPHEFNELRSKMALKLLDERCDINRLCQSAKNWKLKNL